MIVRDTSGHRQTVKTLRFSLLVSILYVLLSPFSAASAADIQAILDSNNGTSGFVVQNSDFADVMSASSNGTVNIGVGTTLPARLAIDSNTAGTTGFVTMESNDGNFQFFVYAGNPQSTVTANPGDVVVDPVGGNMYIKNSGAGNVGWDIVATSTSAINNYNDIADPDGNATIAFTTYTNRWTTALTASDFFKITNTANFGNVSVLTLENSGNPTDGTMLMINNPDVDVDSFWAPGIIIKGSGRVGIGTTVPSTALDVATTINIGTRLTAATTALLDLSNIDASTATEGLLLPQIGSACAGAAAEGQICWDSSSNDLYVGNGATAQKVGGATGNAVGGGWTDAGATIGLTTISDTVGIGDATPEAKLEVQATVATQDVIMIEGAAAQSGNYFEVNSNGQVNGDIVVVKSSGNVGIGTSNPRTILESFATISVTNGGRIAVGRTDPLAGIHVGDGSSGTVNLANGNEDVYIEGNLEVDGNVNLGDAAVDNLTIYGTMVHDATMDLDGNRLIIDADADTSLTADTDDQIDIEIGGADEWVFTASQLNTTRGTLANVATVDGGTGNLIITANDTGEVVVNEESEDVNLRVEGNGDANALFVDAGTDRVAVGNAAPDADLHIGNDSAASNSGMDGNEDLFVEGDIEFDGVIYGNGSQLTGVAAASMAWSDITAPDEQHTINFGSFTQTITTDTDGVVLLTLANTAADLAASSVVLGLDLKDNADVDGIFIRARDNNSATTAFQVGAGGAITMATGSITATNGAINFDNENLTTTGTLAAGAGTLTSLNNTDGNMTNIGDVALDSLSPDATAINVNLGGAAGNDLIIDTSTLVVESDTDQVGVGLVDPRTALEVDGTLAVTHFGKIAVGRSDPAAGIHVGDGSTAGTPSLANAVNDVYIEGDLEVDGSVSLGDAAVDNLTIYGTMVHDATMDLDGNRLIIDADADTSLTADTDDQIDIEIGGADEWILTASQLNATRGTLANVATVDGGTGNLIITANDTGEVVVNEASEDVNLRVEGDGDANALFVDAGTDRVAIGNAAPDADLHIGNDSAASNSGMDGVEDLFVEGDIEFDGTIYGNGSQLTGVAAASMAWSDITAPDEQHTISFGSFTQVITTATDGVTLLTLANTTADLTASSVVLGLDLKDNADVDGIFIRARDNNSATTAFQVGVGGAITMATGSITATNGAINFDNENLTTTGTLAAGAGTLTSLNNTEGNITNVGDVALDSLSPDATAININLGGAAGNDLIVDTSTLVVESDTDQVGVGLVDPRTALEVDGTLAVSHFGRIAVGRSDPAAGIHVGDGSTAGTPSLANATNDVYIEGDLEVDGNVSLGDLAVDTITILGTMSYDATIDLDGNRLIIDADADTSLTADTDDQIDIEIGGADEWIFTASQLNTTRGTLANVATVDGGTGNLIITANDTGEVVVNEASEDVNLRVEGNGDANALFVDAGTDRVAIGNAAPDADLHIGNDSAASNSGMDGAEDLFVEGDIEFDGVIYGNGSQLTGVAAASTAWDDITAPDAAHTINFGSFAQTIRTGTSGTTLLTLANTAADLASTSVVLALDLQDDGDADGLFIRGRDNNSGDTVFTVGANGQVLVDPNAGIDTDSAGAVVIGGTIATSVTVGRAGGANVAVVTDGGTINLDGDITLASTKVIGLNKTQTMGYIELEDDTPNNINLMNANVGIGTTEPGDLLTVSGGDVAILAGHLTMADDRAITLDDNGLAASIELEDETVDNVNVMNANLGVGTTEPTAKLHVVATGSSSAALSLNINTDDLTVTNAGRVGIGNTAPQQTLDVTGSIKASVNIATVDDAYNATNWDNNFNVPTKNAVRDQLESFAAGAIANVGNCNGPNCFTGTEGTTLTSTTADVLSLATDGAIKYILDTDTTVTFMGQDSAAATKTVYDTTGAGTVDVGSADVTAVSAITDGGTVVLDGSVTLATNKTIGMNTTGSLGHIELEDETIDNINLMNANVGVGTTEPAAKLSVVATGLSNAGLAVLVSSANTIGLAVTNSGSVGIGITNPGSSHSLYVNGYVYAGGAFGTNASGTTFINNIGISGNAIYLNAFGGSPYIQYVNSQLTFSSTAPVVFSGGGNVGIGTTATPARLNIVNTGAASSLLINDSFAAKVAMDINSLQTTGAIIDIDATALSTGKVMGVILSDDYDNTATALVDITATSIDATSNIPVIRVATTAANDVDVTLATIARTGTLEAKLLYDEGDNLWKIDQGDGAGPIEITTSTTAGIDDLDDVSDRGNITNQTLFTTGMRVSTDNTVGLGGSNGSIEFENEAIDDINLMNANVGLGTTEPTVKLEVVATGSSNAAMVLSAGNTMGTKGLFVTNAGNVGVGTTNPVAKFVAFSADDIPVALFENTSAKLRIRPWVSALSAVLIDATNGNETGYSALTINATELRFNPAGVTSLTLASTGRVGIGNTAPTVKLEVVATGSSNAGMVLSAGNTTGTKGLFVTNLGRVGIGKTNPQQILDVTGSIKASVNIATVDDAYNATNWDNDLNVPTKNAVRDQLESFAAGAISNVGNCNGPNCFTGTEGTTLTSTTADVLSLATDGAIKYILDTDTTVTFMGQDSAAATKTVYDTTGAGTVDIGSGDVTAISAITDGGTVVLDGSITLAADKVIGLNTTGSMSSIEFETADINLMGADVGIGTTEPTAKLQVVATGTSIAALSVNIDSGDLAVTNAGNVGIGTTAPTVKLEVSSTVAISGGGRLGVGTTAPGARLNVVATGTSSAALSLNIDAGDLVVTNAGRVGIGNTAPTQKLDVTGSVIASVNIATADEAYVSTWNGNNNVPTKNAIYDKIEAISVAAGGWTDGTNVIYTTVSTDKVGIGTATPSAQLETVNTGTSNASLVLAVGTTSSSTGMFVTNAGRVGIGKTNPMQTLDVTGSIKASINIATVDDAYNATNWDNDLNVPTKNAVRDQLESFAAGAISNIGNCNGPNCFTGTEGTTLTSTTADILSLATDGAIKYILDTDTTVTFMGQDSAAATKTVYDTTGAGSVDVGSADVTAVSVITDGGTVVLDGSVTLATNKTIGMNTTGSLGHIELEDETIDDINLMNANVGLGTTEPTAKLQVTATGLSSASLAVLVNSANTIGLAVTNAGNVGIGTTAPQSKLSLAGVGAANGLNINNLATLNAIDGTQLGFNFAGTDRWAMTSTVFYTSTGTGPAMVGSTTVSFLPRNADDTAGLSWLGDSILGLHGGSNTQPAMTINKGQVGIATTFPLARLNVVNTGSASSLRIDDIWYAKVAQDINSLQTTGAIIDIDATALSTGKAIGLTIDDTYDNTATGLVDVTATAVDTTTSIPVIRIATTTANDVDVAAFTVARTGANDAKIIYDEGTDQWMIDNGNNSPAAIGTGTGSGTVNTGAAGAVSYYPSAGTTVDDSPVLFSTTTNVGIGISAPLARLQSVATGTSNASLVLAVGNTTTASGMFITNAGKIGAGTTVPRSPFSIVNTGSTILQVAHNYSDANSAPATISTASYIHLGGQEYKSTNDSYRLISFGYRTGSSTSFPAYLGYQEADGSTGSTKGDLVFGTRSATTDTDPSERVRITSGGLVGIGTSAPTVKLEVVATGSSNAAMVLSAGNTTGTKGLFVTNAGKVGIGVTAPNTALDVSGVINQRASATNSVANYLHTNASLASDQTNLNPGILLFGGPSAGTSQYGMDLAFSGSSYRTRIFTAIGASISFARTNGTPGAQSDFTELMVITPVGNVGIGNTAPVSTLEVAGSMRVTTSVRMAIASISTDTTIGASQHVVLVDTSGGDVTVTLPEAAVAPGREYHIKKTASGNSMIIEGDGAETIDGAANITTTTQYHSFMIISDGTEWHIL